LLYDGCLSGRVPKEVAVAGVEPELAQRITEEDGGAAETYRGILTVAGVRYSFEVLLFPDLDGAYFVANVARFVAMDWSAGMRVVRRQTPSRPKADGKPDWNAVAPRRWLQRSPEMASALAGVRSFACSCMVWPTLLADTLRTGSGVKRRQHRPGRRGVSIASSGRR
jgi:hypothetical protein